MEFLTLVWKDLSTNGQQENEQRTEAVVRRCPIKIGILKNFAKFTGKQLCQSLF